jgi:phosphoribosyl 1,2-cyclic phosphodiesterase
MFRFASLGSGSRGNATLVQGEDRMLLVDCGFPVREVVRRCEALGVDPQRIDALFVTHEHGDHRRGVGALARRFDLPVWMSHGTWHAADFGRLPTLNLFNSHQPPIEIGGLQIQPIPVPHDAREPTQFIVRQGELSLGLLTDLGCHTPHLIRAYAGVDALLLECNHDPDMLAEGPYPPRLQARVGGDFGHLNNRQAAQLLATLDHARLRHLVAAHLSEKNNRPELARRALCEVAPTIAERLTLLQQDRASDWFDLH